MGYRATLKLVQWTSKQTACRGSGLFSSDCYRVYVRGKIYLDKRARPKASQLWGVGAITFKIKKAVLNQPYTKSAAKVQ